mmetsp:Transcript_36417/g.90972  ORF Transcript_36417/g.90972 Transcript_36417/m.90972 type:complete len:237 (-) Transcript_36417:3059-3769(-)
MIQVVGATHLLEYRDHAANTAVGERTVARHIVHASLAIGAVLLLVVARVEEAADARQRHALHDLCDARQGVLHLLTNLCPPFCREDEHTAGGELVQPQMGYRTGDVCACDVVDLVVEVHLAAHAVDADRVASECADLLLWDEQVRCQVQRRDAARDQYLRQWLLVLVRPPEGRPYDEVDGAVRLGRVPLDHRQVLSHQVEVHLVVALLAHLVVQVVEDPLCRHDAHQLVPRQPRPA